MEINEDEIEINNISYHIENEELPDIDYYEILSLDEIVKDNPTFIAFSKEEIYNELYDFFKNKGKADNFTNLFYENIKKKDVTNYILVADVNKKNYNCHDINTITELIENLRRINKSQYLISKTEKNKIFFALTYDDKSDKLRYKPQMKTTIEIKDIDKKIHIFYPIYPSDDTNIPIISSYYKVPVAITNDFLSTKVVSHLHKSVIINNVRSDGYTDINKLFEDVKPKISDIIETIDKDEINDDNEFDFDYNHINNIMEKFDMSLDTINIEDYKVLKELFKDVSKIKEQKFNYKKYKIREDTTTNEKLEFYRKTRNIIELLKFTDIEKKEYEDVIMKLQNDKINISSPNLLYNNIDDIINAITDNVISLEDIIENIRANKKDIVLDYCIDTLKKIAENDVEKIVETLDALITKFTFLKNAIDDISNLHFIDFYKELKDIAESEDISAYDNVPDIYKKEEKYDGMVGVTDDDDLIDFDSEESKKNLDKYNESIMAKYTLSIRYRDSKGFIECLKIVLKIINKIQDISKLQLNYDLLCDELYNKFNNIPSKFDIFKEKAEDDSDNYINEILTFTPEYVINSIDNLININDSMSEATVKNLYDTNVKFISQIFEMLYMSLAWWSIQIQDDIINDTLLFDENSYYISYIDKWSLDGAPFNEKDTKKGVLVYLGHICYDIIDEEKIYTVPDIPLKLIENVIIKINKDYKEDIEKIRKKNIDEKKKIDKGKKTHLELVETIKNKQFDRLVNDYVNALLYMPSYKYKKIHKFLLGCCLQKIDDDFRPDTDLIGVRNDLIAAKNKYGKNRQTNKQRNKKFILYKDKKEVIEEDIEYFKPVISPIIAISDINIWFEYMKDRSSLIPNNILEEFKKNIRVADSYVNKYIKIMVNTTGYKKSTFEKVFLETCDNKYRQVLNVIITIFVKYKTDDENEIKLLKLSLESIRGVLQDINILNKMVDDNLKNDIIRVRRFIIARALCLPCNPVLDNTILKTTINVSSNFIFNISREIHNNIMKYLENTKMPTVEDNIAFINSIREQNKIKILANMNSKSQQERDLLSELKKIGIKHLMEGEEQEIEINKEIVVDDDDGEKDFEKRDEDYDNDDDMDDY